MKRNHTNPICIVLGLDGASYDLIYEWCTKGYLPNLQTLMKKGVYGVLKSTIPANTCPALPAFYTGKNPAKTGIFSFVKPDGSITTTKDIKEPTLWDVLSIHGFRVCIAGLRTAYPPPAVNGIFISGILDPTEDSNFVYPKERKHEFKDFYPSDAFIDKIIEWSKKKNKNKEKIYNYLLDITKNQIKIFENIIEKDKVDFGLLWIAYTDTLQHYFWDDKNLILNFFKNVDMAIGELISNYDKTNFVIFSDHGFGEAPQYEFYLNSWLVKEGYLKIKGNKLGYIMLCLISALADTLPISLNSIKNFIKIYKLKNVDLKSDKDLVIDFPKIPGVDYTRSVACYGTAWGIKILKENVKNYEKIRNEIIEKLKKLRGVEGDKLIKEIWKKEEIYSGKYEKDLPDIIFVINDKYLCRTLIKRKIFYRIKKREWVGNHESARDGIFIAFGPHIRNTGKFIGEIQIYDLMPTILHMYGLPIPNDIDGRVLMEIFNKNSEIYKRKPKYTTITQEKIILSTKIQELKRRGKI